MDALQEERARELVKELELAGLNHGLLVLQGTIVLRGPGAPFRDTPMMHFDEADLYNAVALNLLEKCKVSGSYQWEWYVAKKSKTSQTPSGTTHDEE